MKKIILIIAIILIIIVVGILILNFIPQKIAVLTYHDFTETMLFLKKHNYKTLTLKEIECFMEKKCKIPRKSVLITMDDGWKSEITLALPILKKYNLKATIFYLGLNYESNDSRFMNKNDLKIIKSKYNNIEIASHTYNNHVEEGYLKSKEEIKKDLEQQKEVKKYFAYPYGLSSDEYIEAVKEEKYKLAFTFGPNKEHRKISLKDDKYKLPRYNFSTTYPYYKYVLKILLPID